jgi:hypothetical protein
LSVQAGHAGQDEAEVVAVEDVPELFQAGGFQPVSAVEDNQLGFAAVNVHLVVIRLGVVVRVQAVVDVSA